MKKIFGIGDTYNEMERNMNIKDSLEEIFNIAPDIPRRICNMKHYPVYGQYVDSYDSGSERVKMAYNYTSHVLYEPIESEDIFNQLGHHMTKIASMKKTRHPIAHLINFCQYLCHNYKFPSYEDVKSAFFITHENYERINQCLDESWCFDNSVEKYLSQQYLYRKSLHNPSVDLKKLLKDFLSPAEGELGISLDELRRQKEIEKNLEKTRGCTLDELLNHNEEFEEALGISLDEWRRRKKIEQKYGGSLEELQRQKEVTINKVISNFSSRRAKRRQRVEAWGSAGQETRNEVFKKALEIAKKSEKEVDYYTLLSDMQAEDQFALHQDVIDLSWDDNGTHGNAFNLKETIDKARKYRRRSVFKDNGFIGNFFGLSWKDLSKKFATDEPLTWESIYDFIIINGIFLGYAQYNPFNFIAEYDSYEDFEKNSFFKPDIDREEKFLSQFIPSGILLSSQKECVISVVHYIIERITNINLIHGIMSYCLKLIGDSPSPYELHRVFSIVDDVSILAKYPLVDLRHGFLMKRFNNKSFFLAMLMNALPQNHPHERKLSPEGQNYMSYLIRYQIYFYFPLINRLFHILLSCMISFDYGDFKIPQSGRLFGYIEGDAEDEENILRPEISYCDMENRQNHGRFESLSAYEPWIVFSIDLMKDQIQRYNHSAEPIVVDSIMSSKHKLQILDYIKRKIYYSFYEEMRTFHDFDFISTYLEFKDKPMSAYIQAMDCRP